MLPSPLMSLSAFPFGEADVEFQESLAFVNPESMILRVSTSFFIRHLRAVADETLRCQPSECHSPVLQRVAMPVWHFSGFYRSAL